MKQNTKINYCFPLPKFSVPAGTKGVIAEFDFTDVDHAEGFVASFDNPHFQVNLVNVGGIWKLRIESIGTAPAGTYSGALKLKDAGGAEVTKNYSAEVAPINIDTPSNFGAQTNLAYSGVFSSNIPNAVFTSQTPGAVFEGNTLKWTPKQSGKQIVQYTISSPDGIQLEQKEFILNVFPENIDEIIERSFIGSEEIVLLSSELPIEDFEIIAPDNVVVTKTSEGYKLKVTGAPNSVSTTTFLELKKANTQESFFVQVDHISYNWQILQTGPLTLDSRNNFNINYTLDAIYKTLSDANMKKNSNGTYNSQEVFKFGETIVDGEKREITDVPQQFRATIDKHIVAKAFERTSGLKTAEMGHVIKSPKDPRFDVKIPSQPIKIDYTYVSNESNDIPKEFSLKPNYPNPFQNKTTISVNLPKTGHVHVYLTNVLGQNILTLCDEIKQAGEEKFIFDASQFPSGTYFFNIIAEGQRKVKTLTKVN